jgi:capsular exopolysaccharide synthesis family protein
MAALAVVFRTTPSIMPESPRNHSPSPTAQDNALGGILSALKALRKHWPLVVACLLVGTGAGLFYSRSQPRVYQAGTLLEIDPSPPPLLDDKQNGLLPMGVGFFEDPEEYRTTQFRIITSRDVLSSAVRNLSLTSDYDFLGYNSPPPTPPSVEAVAGALAGHVRVEPVRTSRLAYIEVDDRRPERAKRLCDGIASAYISQNLQQAVDASGEAVAWLSDQLEHIKRQLESDEDKLHEFKEKNDLPSTSINEASNMLRIEMQEFDTALTKTRTQKEEFLARVTELAKVSASDPDQLPSSELLSNGHLQGLRSQYLDAIKSRDALAAEGKGENHPLLRAAIGRAETTRKALIEEIGNIKGAIQRDLDIIKHQEAGESALFEGARKQAVNLNMSEIEYHRLERNRDENEKLFAFLTERMKNADLSRMMKVNNIHVVETAVEPGVPIRPRTSLNVMLGALLGLIAGLGFIFLREQFDTSVKTPDDLEQRLGVTFLGLLPEIEDRPSPVYARRLTRRRNAGPDTEGEQGASELIAHYRPLSGIAEAARSIRTNLMFMNPDHPHRKLLVTSAAPAEGKTTVACSIAIAFAQGAQRVCIVDCDLRRPRLHRIFGRAGDSGVTSVLVGDAALDEVAKPTGIDNLWSVPAGPIPPNPADMFHSERFRNFISDLEERFDRVVIDSPPLVAVTDSAIMSKLVDATVFVVRAFATSRHVSAQGLRTLRDVDAPVVGAVLNAVNLNRQESAYYHYYYYKREGYQPAPSAHDDDDSERPAPN